MALKKMMNSETYTMFALLITAVMYIWLLKQRMTLLEDKLMQYGSATYLNFAKTQLHLEKVAAIKAIRQQFRELSLVQAVNIYEMAVKEAGNS